MYWSYNGYTADLHESVIKITANELRTARGQVYAYEKVVAITGRIIRTTRSDLLSRIAALKSACSSDGGDFVFKFSDNTDSGDGMTNTSTTGGVRVSPVSFPEGTGGEFSTWRKYAIQIKGTIASGIGLGMNPIIEFRENMAHGNPTAAGNWELIPIMDGEWQAQTGYPTGKHQLTQSGTIVGLYGYPTVPSPVYSTSPPYKPNLDKIAYGDPRRVEPDGTFYEWPVTYSYSFESGTAMTPLATPDVL